MLRRAFEDLKLDGILCRDNSPIIYFRVVDRLDTSEVMALHRTFWNQGVAPILVLVGSDEVHIYSGLTPPAVRACHRLPTEGFVERLDRVGEELQAFLIAVETGEYYPPSPRAFRPATAGGPQPIRHLEAARELLARVRTSDLDPDPLDALLCRIVFTCYLFDRKMIDRNYLEDAGISEAAGLADILGRKPRSRAKDDLYALFAQLGEDFNGDLFSDDLGDEARHVQPEHLVILKDFIRGTDPKTRQPSFWPYEFGIIPIETISAIYEHFLKAAGRRRRRNAGAFYTPRF